MQQGGKPSPFDRNHGTKMAAKTFNWLVEQLGKPDVFDHTKNTACTNDKNTIALLGLKSRKYEFQPVQDLKAETDFKYRRWKHMWWKQIRSIMRILAQHDSTYASEVEEVGVDEPKGFL